MVYDIPLSQSGQRELGSVDINLVQQYGAAVPSVFIEFSPPR